MSRLSSQLNAQFVVAADGDPARDTLKQVTWHRVPMVAAVQSKGYLESVLDQALQFCDGQYILRLDDDERASQAMISWLQGEEYKHNPHWKFPRAHLWGDTRRVLLTPQLWPDHQTRMSIRSMAGGRNWIHCGSPHGGGAATECVIEHHKFLVKNADERWAIAHRYDGIAQGTGTGGMMAFNVPEHSYCNDDVWFGDLGYGDARSINATAWKQEGGLR